VSIRGAGVATLVAACLCASSAGATTFTEAFRGPARALGEALSQTVARSLPVTSASPGITFTYDPTSGSFERDTDLLGQLYLERARPIGRGKWNVALSYQRVHIDSVQGESLDSLQDDAEPIVVVSRPRQQRPPPPRGAIPIKYFHYDVGLTVNEVTLAATYGITENLDVNMTLPILASSLSVDADGSAFRVNPNSGSLIPIGTGVTAGTFQDASLNAAGVGDLFLRGKYRFLAAGWGDLAAGLVLRMPTGNQDDFQGTGDWEISPLLYASTRRWLVGYDVGLQGFFNGGLDLNADDVSRSEGRFGVGLDVAFASRATLSIAFLGREPFSGFAPSGFFDVPRYRRSNNTCDPSGRTARGCPTAPLFGLETARPSYYSLSIGGRVNLWRDTVFGFANVLIPLLDQGIHTDPIPLVGFEATF
jgi:hypothetical protein